MHRNSVQSIQTKFKLDSEEFKPHFLAALKHRGKEARLSAADFLAKATMIFKAKKQLIALCSDRELPTLLGRVASEDKEKTVKIAGCKAFHGLNELKVLDAKKCRKMKEAFHALKNNKRTKKYLEEATKQYNAEKGGVSAAAGSKGGILSPDFNYIFIEFPEYFVHYQYQWVSRWRSTER